jgi:hypothetical protein
VLLLTIILLSVYINCVLEANKLKVEGVDNGFMDILMDLYHIRNQEFDIIFNRPEHAEWVSYLLSHKEVWEIKVMQPRYYVSVSLNNIRLGSEAKPTHTRLDF